MLVLALWLAVPLASDAGGADEAAVRAAVELANSPAVWGAALRSGDPAPLALAWTGDPLAYFSGEVLEYRARGLRLLSTLESLEFLAVRLLDAAHAEAHTRERWHDFLCSADGEPRGERRAYAEDQYTLTLGADGWRVSGVEITLLDGSFDWDPVAADGRQACAAVVSVDS